MTEPLSTTTDPRTPGRLRMIANELGREPDYRILREAADEIEMWRALHAEQRPSDKIFASLREALRIAVLTRVIYEIAEFEMTAAEAQKSLDALDAVQ